MIKEEISFTHPLTVVFKDTDMAGIVHFTQLLAYVEAAEHAALLSVNVPPVAKEGGFPKVHIDCDYLSPARFCDELEINLWISEVGDSSVHWSFQIVNANKVDTTIAEGSMVTVYVNAKGRSQTILDEHRASLTRLLVSS